MDGSGDTGRDRPGSQGSTGAGPIAAQRGPCPERWCRLPLGLRERAQWLMAGPDAKGDLKVPTSVNAAGDLIPGSSTGRHTWLTFDRAAEAAAARGLGIGYVLAWDDPFCCIDLDVKDHTTPEQIAYADSIYKWLASYTEHSQSGRGLHVWCRGKIGEGRKDDGVEVYSQERFIACTGDVLFDCPIMDRQSGIDKLVATMSKPGVTKNKDILNIEEPEPEPLTDDELRAKLEGSGIGPKFVEFWNGSWQQFIPARQAKFDRPDKACDVSQSAFDLEFMGMLIYNRANCTRNREQAIRMFMQSVMAANIKRKGGPNARRNYLEATLAYALNERKATRDALNTWLGSCQPAWDAELAARKLRSQF